MKDGFKYKGKVKIINLATGNSVCYSNVVTNLFYVKASNLLIGNGANSIDYLALGDGTSSPLPTDTTLGNELFRTSIDAKSVDASTGKITLTTDIAGAEAVFVFKEVGLFDSSSSGVMTNRASIASYDHTTGDDIRIVYTIEKV